VAKKLPPAQKLFCFLLATPDEDGRRRTQATAYKQAYPKSKGHYPAQKAAELLRNPKIKAEVERLEDRFRAEIEERAKGGIAIKANRILDSQDLYDRLRQVILERSQAHEMRRAPGGTSGLVVRTLKKIGSGEDAETIEEFKLDTGLMAELARLKSDVAKELGQLESKIAVKFDLAALTEEELDHLELIRSKIAEP
jgi:hypothetical protein